MRLFIIIFRTLFIWKTVHFVFFTKITVALILSCLIIITNDEYYLKWVLPDTLGYYIFITTSVLFLIKILLL